MQQQRQRPNCQSALTERGRPTQKRGCWKRLRTGRRPSWPSARARWEGVVAGVSCECQLRSTCGQRLCNAGRQSIAQRDGHFTGTLTLTLSLTLTLTLALTGAGPVLKQAERAASALTKLQSSDADGPTLPKFSSLDCDSWSVTIMTLVFVLVRYLGGWRARRVTVRGQHEPLPLECQ